MIAVYAGSFDPVTAGHLAVIRRAARLFSHLRVVVADNPQKRYWFSQEERAAMVREATAHMPNVSVAEERGLVVEHARAIGAAVLVRGVRGASDAAHETGLSWLNERLAPDVATVLLPCPPELAELSSSSLKERALGGEPLGDLCSPAVAERLRVRAGEARA
jgi:pantetheine-phosphate adenylyltransferase